MAAAGKPAGPPRAGRPPPGGAVLDRLDRAVDWLARLAAWLGALVTIAMTAIVGYGVGMRYLLNRPQPWSDELVSYLVVLVVMLAAAEALRRGEHISIDLITERLGACARRRVEMAGLAAVIATCTILIASGLEMVAFSRLMGIRSTGYLAMPVWLPQAAVPLGFALLLLAAANRLLRLLLRREDARQ